MAAAAEVPPCAGVPDVVTECAMKRMLRYTITMSKTRDMHVRAGEPAASTERPLNARSLALSALLGTHPPTLPASALVALAELFGVNGGAMRTALSRMVAAGDVVVVDARYTLSPRLAERQRAQDAGRRNVGDWDGRWHTAVAVTEQRSLADRRRLRVVMANARFGELRPAIWLRPANVPAPILGDDWLVTTGDLTGIEPGALVERLWDLDALATTGRDLERRLAAAQAHLDPHDPQQIPPTFVLAAEVLRALRGDPLLPHALVPQHWPFDALRERYATFERDLQSMLRPFLSASSRPTAQHP